MFSGQALAQVTKQMQAGDPNASLDASIMLLGQILGKDIKKAQEGFVVPGAGGGGSSDIVRAFLASAGHSVAPLLGQKAVPGTTAPATGVAPKKA